MSSKTSSDEDDNEEDRDLRDLPRETSKKLREAFVRPLVERKEAGYVIRHLILQRSRGIGMALVSNLTDLKMVGDVDWNGSLYS